MEVDSSSPIAMNVVPKKTYLLTGDIGGTNSRIFLYDPEGVEPLWTHQYRNAQHIPSDRYSFPTIFQDNIIAPFLEECWDMKKDLLEPIENVQIVAVLAVAGVVEANRVTLTNLGNVVVDGNAITFASENKYMNAIMRCRIINDFAAVRENMASMWNRHLLFPYSQQGYGCLTLKNNEVRPLFGPSDVENLPVEPKVCVGAGTGLGECYLTPDLNGNYSCYASEGGHVEFAPRNETETKMFHYLGEKFASHGRISVERVVSGKGLANVYDFLANENASKISPEIHEEFLAAEDEQGRVVAVNAGEKGSLCHNAMSIMMSAYGCEVGSAAIKWIPKGGLFLTGGLTPKNIQYIEGLNSDFMIAYRNKGRVTTILDQIPLFAVMVESLGVRGAHKAALMEYANLAGIGSLPHKEPKRTKLG